MGKATHREVKFSPAEMADDGSDEIDFNRARYCGRGREGLEMAKRISQAQGAEKRKLVESLPRMADRQATDPRHDVHLDPDVAAVFKDSAGVNKALRAFAALMDAIPAAELQKRRSEHRKRKTA